MSTEVAMGAFCVDCRVHAHYNCVTKTTRSYSFKCSRSNGAYIALLLWLLWVGTMR